MKLEFCIKLKHNYMYENNDKVYLLQQNSER